ncbi:replication protein [Serratia quinivorans]|uniref:replication initiation protein n=1 Tax=Serratia TaxID=613 RepID=UPI001F4C3180|nr:MULTISPECIES: replication initiation protein [Serratia]ULG15168.1 RepA [Serratia proteamaculans]ULG15276.1 RepA [Serratia proteamaculans]CAI1243636.1 replication protein [Serratia quinivorans]CAI1249635.1 replication protein [Serratia quinivorans]CAI2027329.1 replication protein [Serratia quinivorans]
MNHDTLTVVQGNDLLEGAYGVTLDEMRLLNLALAQIDSRKPQPDMLYTLYPRDYQRIYGVNPTSSHRQLRDAADSLMKKPVTIYKEDRNGKVRTVQLSWFSRLEYVSNDDHSAVVLRFGQDVAPYLFELKESFTKLDFINLARLDTPFSIRLYSWLVKARNLTRYRSHGTIEVTLEIEWMREKANLQGKYQDYRDFRQKLLQPSLDRINASTDISVIWEPVKIGRSVHAIKFTYVDESTPEAVKPMRPRLPRRPHVTAGSAAEGEWARKCISLLTQHMAQLEAYDPNEKVSVPDLRKLAGWYNKVGHRDQERETLEAIKLRAQRRKTDQ